MKVLLTGASGFLGSAIARALIKNQHQVRALVLPGDPARGLENLDVERVSGNVLLPETLGQVLAGCDAVIHTAGRVSLRACRRKSMYQLNVEGTRNLAQAAKTAHISRFVHISSSGVLGANLKPCAVDENHPAPGALSQKHHYHQTKIAAEAAVITELKNSVELVCILPTMLWGPGDWALSSTGYAFRALQGDTLYYTRQGGTNILDVDDAANGVVAALLKGRSGERYILAGENISIEQMCRLIAAAIPSPCQVKPVPLPLITGLGVVAECLGFFNIDMDFSLDIRRQSGNYWWADASKAQAELGFRCHQNAQSAISRSLTWMKQNQKLLKLI